MITKGKTTITFEDVELSPPTISWAELRESLSINGTIGLKVPHPVTSTMLVDTTILETNMVLSAGDTITFEGHPGMTLQVTKVLDSGRYEIKVIKCDTKQK